MNGSKTWRGMNYSRNGKEGTAVLTKLIDSAIKGVTRREATGDKGAVRRNNDRRRQCSHSLISFLTHFGALFPK